jgi:hypothetical protein
MNVYILLRDTKTDEEQWVDSTYRENDDGIWYQWQEGNYSCDCNRKIFFEKAKGTSSWDYDTPCGDGRYRIVATRPEIGLRDLDE